MHVRLMQHRQVASLRVQYRSVYGAPLFRGHFEHPPLVGCDLRAVDNCRGIGTISYPSWDYDRKAWETPEIQIFHLSGYSAITTYIGDNSDDTSFRFVDRSLRAAAPISRML